MDKHRKQLKKKELKKNKAKREEVRMIAKAKEDGKLNDSLSNASFRSSRRMSGVRTLLLIGAQSDE